HARSTRSASNSTRRIINAAGPSDSIIVDSPPGPSRYKRPTVCVPIRDSSGPRYGNRFSTRRLIPPPHGLFLGNLDRSSSRTVTPAFAKVRAAVAPAGPAPTTITNDVSGNLRIHTLAEQFTTEDTEDAEDLIS